MKPRGRAAVIAAAFAIPAALAACAAPKGAATTTRAPSANPALSSNTSRAPEIKDLAGLQPLDVVSILGPPDLRLAEPPAELWQYRAADCVLNLFFFSDAAGYRLAHAEAWQRSLSGGVPARCHDEDAPIRAHLVSQSSF